MAKPSTTSATPEMVVASVTTEALLDAIVQLTHRIHAAGEHARDYRGSDRAVLDARMGEVENLRAQRSLARAELIRRDERRLMLEATRLTVVQS